MIDCALGLLEKQRVDAVAHAAIGETQKHARVLVVEVLEAGRKKKKKKEVNMQRTIVSSQKRTFYATSRQANALPHL